MENTDELDLSTPGVYSTAVAGTDHRHISLGQLYIWSLVLLLCTPHSLIHSRGCLNVVLPLLAARSSKGRVQTNLHRTKLPFPRQMMKDNKPSFAQYNGRAVSKPQ